jgi:hypothetical protein
MKQIGAVNLTDLVALMQKETGTASSGNMPYPENGTTAV